MVGFYPTSDLSTQLAPFPFAVNNRSPAQRPILIGDDNEDDALLTETALLRSQINIPTRIVHDGEQVLDYLRGAAPFDDRAAFPFPRLLLLDLHMPRLNGLQVVVAVRAIALCQSLPIVIVSGSDLADNVANSYNAGANEFIYKSTDFDSHRRLICDAVSFWLALEPSDGHRRPPRGVRFWNPVPNHLNPFFLSVTS